MKKILSILSASLLSAAVWAAQQAPAIIPQPQSIVTAKGSCKVSGISINCDPGLESRTIAAVYGFADNLSLACGRTSTVATSPNLRRSAAKGEVKGLAFTVDNTLGAEEYNIDIKPKSIVVRASAFNGFFYAIQTLKQMLPKEVYNGTRAKDGTNWRIPCCSIKDKPRFAYRGMHLDCSRHFFSVEEVKKYLDVMSMYKINRFHWHLTDDQGWRIEIRKYPLLTEVGAYRSGTCIKKDFSSSDGIRYGGFYTRAQIEEIIRYADARGIEIVPEVDLPGHMLAALAAYPQLGCTGGPYQVWTRWGVSPQVLCPGKEETMQFLEDVLAEVAEIFPGRYIHIGGDECPKQEWEQSPECQAKIKELGLVSDGKASAEQRLQNYVTARMQAFLATKGKKVIGWDEVLEGELAEGATVMSWRGSKGGIEAAKAGYDVIMTPNDHCYFDYYQSEDRDSEPFGIGGKLPMSKVYSLDPLKDIPEECQGRILGVQANLWTEYIADPAHLEYMLLPRMLALSEIQWSSPESRDYDRLLGTLKAKEYPIFELLGYNYKKY